MFWPFSRYTARDLSLVSKSATSWILMTHTHSSEWRNYLSNLNVEQSPIYVCIYIKVKPNQVKHDVLAGRFFSLMDWNRAPNQKNNPRFRLNGPWIRSSHHSQNVIPTPHPNTQTTHTNKTKSREFYKFFFGFAQC